jgi:hypothetical protein
MRRSVNANSKRRNVEKQELRKRNSANQAMKRQSPQLTTLTKFRPEKKGA